MNLVNGEILETKDCDAVLDTLRERILVTLAGPGLNPDTVIGACDRLVKNLDETQYLSVMAELGIPAELGKSYIAEAKILFSGDTLRYRMKIELGENYNKPRQYTPPFDTHPMTEWVLPLGTLLHVAAGNADGLPAFSVLEGLLTGNINILKLPAAEGGVSVRLLSELIKIEPSLAEYIYVFDYSSKDIIHIKKLIDVADAAVVWGGVEAVSAFRQMIPPNVKLIEWGHKLSFAYVTADGLNAEKCAGLAENIAATGQLLCSSCQGIFLDTDSEAHLMRFCEMFLPMLEEASVKKAKDMGMGVRCQTALELYTAELETVYTGHRIFKSEHASLTACYDTVLEPSIGFANPWVRPLPRDQLLVVLQPYKNYLQTVGLLCGDLERDELAKLFFRTGIVRVCAGERMSAAYAGAAHDGEYPLRRYTKIAALE